jgi:probable HAF family extracellular repeat protein
MRVVIALLVSVVVIVASIGRVHADDRTMLIELEARAPAFTSGVSASGAVVVGGLLSGGGFYWMPTTGVIFNGGFTSSDVSRDGHTIVGVARDSRGIDQAGIWVRGTEWRLLGSFSPNAAPCDTSLSSANGVSRDGQVVVGFARDGCGLGHAFRWTASTGMVDLGSSVAGRASYAIGVSGDGNVVVGYQESATGPRQGARWLTGRQELIPGADGFVGQAMATNNDGSIVVGHQCRPALGTDSQSAWMWTAQNGTTCLPAPKVIPSPGPLILVEANATSDDGQVVGGGQNVGGSADSNAIIWIGGKSAYLKDFLRANGVPDAFNTWVNTGEITGISPDGRILVGWGAAALGFRSYLVILGSSRVIP